MNIFLVRLGLNSFPDRHKVCGNTIAIGNLEPNLDRARTQLVQACSQLGSRYMIILQVTLYLPRIKLEPSLTKNTCKGIIEKKAFDGY